MMPLQRVGVDPTTSSAANERQNLLTAIQLQDLLHLGRHRVAGETGLHLVPFVRLAPLSLLAQLCLFLVDLDAWVQEHRDLDSLGGRR